MIGARFINGIASPRHEATTSSDGASDPSPAHVLLDVRTCERAHMVVRPFVVVKQLLDREFVADVQRGS
jgi:hypothetical protein